MSSGRKQQVIQWTTVAVAAAALCAGAGIATVVALATRETAFPHIGILLAGTGASVVFTGALLAFAWTRRNEAQQKGSEARFRLLADSAPVQIFITSAEGQVTWLNRRWSEFVGKPIEAGLGRGWADFVMAEDLQPLMDIAELAVAHKRPYRVQYRLKRHDGNWRWMISEGIAMIADDGTYTGYVGTAFDANDQIEAVRVLRESEANLRALSADLTQSEARLQVQLERMTLLDRTTRAIGEHLQAGNIFDVVLQCLDEHLEVDVGCIALLQSGESTLVVDRVGDRGSSLARSAGLAEGTVIPVNSEKLRDAVSGKMVYDEELALSTSALIRRLASHGLQSLVLVPLRTERKIYGVLLAARSVPWGFSSHDREFLRQLSEHVGLAIHQAQLREELQRAYDELRQTQQTLMQQARLRAFGEMASGVAHDINNALSPAALYVESLLQTEIGLSEEGREALETTSRAIASVAQTIARMREFYRRRETQASTRTVDLNAVIKQTLLLTRARWKDIPESRGVRIRVVCRLDPELAPVRGEESELRDAFTNLVLNAVDAMPAGGTLTVRSFHREGRVVAEVVDTGVGMDEATRQRCIEPFFTTKGERGTGLGLAMVYGMAERHGANLQIESTPREGTLVRLAFMPGTTPPSQDATASTAQGPSQSLRLLLVDDDPGVLRVLQKLLQREGHLVSIYESGSEALAALIEARARGAPFDALISDLGMPEMDGRRLATLAKNESPGLPVILLTGWGQNISPQSEASVDHVLSKPPSLAELRETLAGIASG